MGRFSNGCTRHAAGRRDAQGAGEEGEGPHGHLTAEQQTKTVDVSYIKLSFGSLHLFQCLCTSPLVWNAIFQIFKDVFWQFRERIFVIGLTKVSTRFTCLKTRRIIWVESDSVSQFLQNIYVIDRCVEYNKQLKGMRSRWSCVCPKWMQLLSRRLQLIFWLKYGGVKLTISSQIGLPCLPDTCMTSPKHYGYMFCFSSVDFYVGAYVWHWCPLSGIPSIRETPSWLCGL